MTDATAKESATRALREEEYIALLNGLGVARTPFSAIAIRGRDRIKFLHNFCTANIKSLSPNQGCEAFVLNVKGKTIGFGYVVVLEQEIYFITPSTFHEELIRHWTKYVITEDVQFESMAQSQGCWCLSARVSEHIARTWSPAANETDYLATRFATILNALDGVPYLFSINSVVDQEPFIAIQASLFSGRDIMVLVAHRAESQWLKTLSTAQVREVSSSAFEVARIEHGTPIFGMDISEANLPQEVARDELAISFKKGCYLGQETVARIDALGHVNKSMVQFEFSGSEVPLPGTPLNHNDKVIGLITSTCFSFKFARPIGIGYLNRNVTQVDIDLGPEYGRVKQLGS
ncbi:MAG TPA: glycine cleavage T C-terminal barrel domain-containing protein [Pirellulaceae bacterium]|nr:glycine cleavage T C-terminal barrel domain-containing protein [Pirellulaceae bacterium]HMO90879.1 glycine cleavage T C-terminal barrel domain-containing protein [Pirellulaceae bacterium]HMP68645.1 glycine cleavage T C-terminal barrel domain-containing protein [Pirellulaceae bacterium]